MVVKYFYEGLWANSKDVLSSSNNTQEMFCVGKNKPRMWWGEFEIRLTNTFVTVDKDAGRQVHTDKSKLSLLNKEIRAEFLTTTKTTIDTQMSVIPMTMTYSSVPANYRDTVNQRFPNEYYVKSNNRRIQTTCYCGGRGGRCGCGHQDRSGRGGRGGQYRGTGRKNDD